MAKAAGLKRVADVTSEDGALRSPLSGMFPPHLPVPESLPVALRPVRDQVPAGVELSAAPTGPGHRILSQVPNCDALVAQAHNVARNLASKYPHMSEHERAALVLYTMEDYPRENSPYFVMNRALRDKNRAAVRPWRDYIWLVMHGMRKIPEPTDVWQLTRGCKDALGNEYKIGQTIQWAAFSSTATNIGVMNEFVGTVGKRTLFQVRLLSPSYGRSLQDFSLFPDESEILLAPGCTFDVTSIFDAGNGLTMVQLQQVPSADQILDLSSSAKPTNFQPTHVPCDPVPKQAAKPIIAVSSDWMNVIPYCLKEGLQDLHDQLYGNLGSSKSKEELVDAICSHSSGIAILKKVPVDALREILIHEAGLAPKDAKALKKEEIIEKLRRGELRVPAPKAAATMNTSCPSASAAASGDGGGPPSRPSPRDRLIASGPIWLKSGLEENGLDVFLSAATPESHQYSTGGLYWLAPHAQEWELFSARPGSRENTIVLYNEHFKTLLLAQAIWEDLGDSEPVWIASQTHHSETGAAVEWEVIQEVWPCGPQIILKNLKCSLFLSAQARNKRSDHHCGLGRIDSFSVVAHDYIMEANFTSRRNGVYLSSGIGIAEKFFPLARGSGGHEHIVPHFGSGIPARNALA
jgi:hypothetical protein